MNRTCSGDSSLLKSLNKTALLRLIRSASPISRAELAKRTKLTRATVSALVDEFITDRLVVETGIGDSNGGRRPVMLELNREAGYVFGLDLKPGGMILVVADARGTVVRRITDVYEQPGSAEAVLDQIVRRVETERAQLPETPHGLMGLCAGIHGFVAFPESTVLYMPHTGWRNLAWRERLEERLGVPVQLDNEANLAAVGEYESGAGQSYSDLLYVSVGTGIGAGFIFGGTLYRGSHGFAGEAGHATIETNGRPCPCGNRGCWELYASERALAERLGLDGASATAERIAELLASGGGAARRAAEETGACLAAGIGNMAHMLNPQIVVIGNRIARYSEWLLPPLTAALAARYSPLQGEPVRVVFSRLGEDAAAIGAVQHMLGHLFER